MTTDELKRRAHRANLDLQAHGLVVLTWGNASAVDRERGVMAIKPSGVDYRELEPENLVLVNLETGERVDTHRKPSSDTATHLALYRSFPEIGGIVHTHSAHATAWAQAGRDLPCYGTTHADYFYGSVPCTPPMTPEEIAEAYEHATGVVIARTFSERRITALEIPAVLVHGHAPFCWGATVEDAVEHAVVLEAMAGMAVHTLMSNPNARPISQALLDKHFLRKHGPTAYYGQFEK